MAEVMVTNKRRWMKLQRKHLRLLCHFVILLSVNSSTLWWSISVFVRETLSDFKHIPRRWKSNLLAVGWAPKYHLIFGFWFPAVGTNSIGGFTHAKLVNWNVLAPDLAKNDPSMPGIIVAKVAPMLLHKQASLSNAHRPPFADAQQHRSESKHSYLQNLEEHLLNCFPKDRSYPQKQPWFSNQTCV